MTTSTMRSSHDRFKTLESADRRVLDGTAFHAMRLDGRSFSSYTRGLDEPFDDVFVAAMDTAATATAQEFGALVTYVASDEVSLVLTGAGLGADMPFAGKADKLLSVAAAHMTAHFNRAMGTRTDKLATFDARVVTLTGVGDVREYLAWRQADTYRNAVAMAAQSLFTHAALLGVSTSQARAMVEEHNLATLEQTYPTGVLQGRQVRREVREQELEFTHSRTGQVGTATALRSTWDVTTAPRYAHLSDDAMTDVLTRSHH